MESKNSRTTTMKKHAARKNLLRYIHTQSYSRISGFRGVKIYDGVRRNRVVFSAAAVVLFFLGLTFVLF